MSVREGARARRCLRHREGGRKRYVSVRTKVGTCQGINQPFVRLCRHPRSLRPLARMLAEIPRQTRDRAMFVRKYAIALPPSSAARWTLATRAMIYIQHTSPPASRITVTFFLVVLFHSSVCLLSSPLVSLFRRLVASRRSPQGHSAGRIS